MPEYLAPGVYVEEVDTGSKPIEGVSTSTAGMVGVTERGPVNVPILITSFGEFQRWFGGYLSIREFSDPITRQHCYLPHAVEGFFLNGGKRLFVTRVVDTELARGAVRMLFHNAASTPATTVLLRAATVSTGSVANPPSLIALSGSNLTVGDWVRVGDGSSSEYQPVAAINAENVVVPLHLPFARGHASLAPIRQFTLPAAAATFTLATDTRAGTATLDIEGTTANINALAPDQLLQIGGAAGEYRFTRVISNVADIGGTNSRARVTLDAPLMLAHLAGVNQVARHSIPASPPAPAPVQVTPASPAGTPLVFVSNRGGAFNTRTDLVIVDEPDLERREVRRIGELHEVTLRSGVTLGCPAGTVVNDVPLNPSDAIQIQAGTITTTSFPVNDITHLTPGQRVLVGTTQRVVTGLNPGTGTAGTLLVSPALGGAPLAGTVILPMRTLVTSSHPDANFLTLDNRLGLAVGDVLRIASGPDEEFAEIAGLPDRAAPGVKPDAGNVLLAHPLARSYDRATTEVSQFVPATGTVQPTVAVLGAASGATTLLLADGAGYTANRTLTLRTADGELSYHRVAVLRPVAVPMMVDLAAPLQNSHPVGAPLVERVPLLRVHALDAGAWGNRLRVSVQEQDPPLLRTQIRAIVDPTHIRLNSASGVETGTVLGRTDITGALMDTPFKVISIEPQADHLITLDPANPLPGTAALGDSVRSFEFLLNVHLVRQPDAAMPGRNDTVQDSESFRYLSMDPRHSRYIEKVTGTTWNPGAAEDNAKPPRPLRLEDRRSEGESRYIRIRDIGQDLPEGPPAPPPHRLPTLESIRLGPEPLWEVLPEGRRRPARHALADGRDSVGTITDLTYVGADDPDPLNRTGLFSLRNEEEISLVACPGRFSLVVQDALVRHCELMRYRFAVLDAQRPPNDSLNDVQNQRQQFDTKYAALYHPWLLIPDPFPTALSGSEDFPIPPSGHVMGIYARTDIERGVHKAPANEVVRGVIGLQRLLNKGEQDILNPYPVNINVIRDFRPNNRGIRVWGGRVITSDPDWKYVNVRRLLIFIEASIERGLQWVVFEPNAEPLWARVSRTVSNFLTSVWRDGALEGTKPEEAYFVRVDRSTMTQTDIDNGRLIVLIGVAPVKPAEFVIIRIGLWTAHADS